LTRIFFCTDLHGSEKCWRKLVNAGEYFDADILIAGGDLTGKAFQPIIRRPDGTWECTFEDRKLIFHSEDELTHFEKELAFKGFYTYRTTLEELSDIVASKEKIEDLFIQLQIERLKKWISFAEQKLKGKKKIFVCPGNDDRFDIDSVFKESDIVINCEGKVINIDDHWEMVSTGWTNPTPWKTYREEPEDRLLQRLESLINKVENVSVAIFNFHAPPYASGLDDAPKLVMKNGVLSMAGADTVVPVGSKAVRQVIEKYQPLMGLHGHIHEVKARTLIGRTVCFNPGSAYTEGTLNAVIIDLDKKKGIKNWHFISG
jgi:Icc-related predicted phosphoesterase